MLSIIRVEWTKAFRKWRTYVGFGVVLGALLLLFTGLRFSDPTEAMAQGAFRRLGGGFIYSGNIVNGLFIAQFIMNTLIVHIPLLVAFMAGDLVAGEASAGTFRLYLTRPVTRIKVIFSKYLVGLVYSTLLVLFLGTVSLFLGWALFGRGVLVVVSDGITVFWEKDGLMRYAMAYSLAIVSMWTVASLALLFSTLVRNAIGPIIGTMGVMIAFLIVSNMKISLFKKISPFLFTSYFEVWREMFNPEIPWNDILTSVSVLFLNMIIFFSAAALVFTKKDILT